MRFALILGGGSGTRMGAGRNKVLLPVGGISMLARSVLAFRPYTDGIVIVLRPEEREAARQSLLASGVPDDAYQWAMPGETRQASVASGLDLLRDASDSDIILIHDGARCLVDAPTILAAIDSVLAHGSGVAAVPVTDTISVADEAQTLTDTPDRDSLRVIQTPQAFALKLIRLAHRAASEDGYQGTDDASLLHHIGLPVYFSPGSRRNIKLTTPEDMVMANALAGMDSLPRIGTGYDVHRLVPGRDLILCGVKVPHETGLDGHSDADVAVHALIDAMLGACALGDIGRLFPDSDPAYKGIDSLVLLSRVRALCRENGCAPVNTDLTIAAQRPKLQPYILTMRENIARVLELPLERVSVKATTTERLGFEGREEGISAQAVCLMAPAV